MGYPFEPSVAIKNTAGGTGLSKRGYVTDPGTERAIKVQKKVFHSSSLVGGKAIFKSRYITDMGTSKNGPWNGTNDMVILNGTASIPYKE